ncbi:MAG: ABC transporter ATP-binding protein [Acidimicrobiia bacterium]
MVRTPPGPRAPGLRSPAPSPALAVRARRLCQSYPAGPGRRRGAEPIDALRGIDFDVEVGEVHGLLGPNGAGKTTLCRILATVLLPTSGSVHVLGFDVAGDVRQVRQRIGIVFDGDRGLYPRLTARQNLHFWAALYGVPGPSRGRLAERLLNRVGLSERAGDRVERYSRGMRQRLHLARALVGDPRLLLLDEPTTGMDPMAAIDFRALITELRSEGRTILLTTHNLAEAEHLCDRVTLIDGGVVVATERPAALAANRREGFRVEADDVPEWVAAEMAAVAGVRVAVPARGRLVVEAGQPALPVVVSRLLEAGVRSLRVGQPGLEETYLTLLGDRGMAVSP